jgi:hypothetical protein
VTVVPEFIWYPGVDGKVEREQFVLTCRRGFGFVHVEAYGRDLYVGWDTHVNAATWAEETLATGIDRATGRHVIAKRVVAAPLSPSEYDLTDASFLTEWLHTNVVALLRLKMAEHRIDQEIDFQIQRESRRGVLKQDADRGESPLRRAVARVKRVG